MIVFYYGEDGFRLREHVRKTIEQFKEKRDPQGYNVFECEVEKPDDFWGAISSVPFMAEKKMVVLGGVFGSKNKELQKQLDEKLDSFVARDDLVLLLYEVGGGFKSALWKKMCALPYAQEFPLLKGDVLHGWIRECVGDAMTVEHGALVAFAKQYGDDMWQLKHAIDQVVAFVQSDGRAIIGESDVLVFVPEAVDDNTFHVLDAIHAGNAGRALKLLDDQWKSGKSVVEVVGLLLWQWRILLQVKGLLEREPGFRGKDVARELKLHPFVADKSCKLVREASYELLEGKYQTLIDIDLSSKSGGLVHAQLARFVVNE